MGNLRVKQAIYGEKEGWWWEEDSNLRRNKEDVLTELPQLIEKEEWLDLELSELKPHMETMEGVAKAGRNNFAGSFMTLRKQANFCGSNGKSAKLSRVQELVDEYRECGRNVVVFSFFRDVLKYLGETYTDAFFIHGNIPPSKRDQTIQDFEQAGSKNQGSVLLSQITAGGVGLNMQCASAAIIVEPQLNPAVEYQAVCRLHRMGQRNTVAVHRLFTKGTIEEALYKLLEKKRNFMLLYARDSALKEGSESAVSRDEVLAAVEAHCERLMSRSEAA